jgi:hypothetical protein
MNNRCANCGLPIEPDAEVPSLWMHSPSTSVDTIDQTQGFLSCSCASGKMFELGTLATPEAAK